MTTSEATYRASLTLVVYIAQTLDPQPSRHWRMRDGRLLRTLDEVVRAILNDDLEVKCTQCASQKNSL